MSIIPSVRAVLHERYVLNFRMQPERMKAFIPVPWLRPAEVGGYAVASFCLLDLRNITVAPLPALAGLSSLSCAPRYAVIDESTAAGQPAVFVTERYTNSAFGAWFTSLGFSAPHPYVGAEIAQEASAVRLSVADGGKPLFQAEVAAGTTSGSIFDATSFAAFIAAGVSSYGLSIHEHRLTRVDLHKDDGRYESLRVAAVSGPVVDEWLAAGAVLDSAFRTQGGKYEWTYRGLTDVTAD